MGWKAFAIFATERKGGYFGTAPAHDSELAEARRKALGLAGYEPLGRAGFEDAVYPGARRLYLGAYAHGLAICEPDLPCYFFDARSRRRISGTRIRLDRFQPDLLALYPQGEVLSIVLHSVVNLWGYSLHSAGTLVRMAAGAADDRLIVNHGAPLPEEMDILRECPIEHVDEEARGEELVFAVASRFFGARLDELDDVRLEFSEYRKTPAGLFGWLRRMIARG